MRKILNIFFVAFLGAFCWVTKSHSQSIPQKERMALEAFYKATGGETTWVSDYRWNLKGNVKDWFGVIIENDHVVGISLSKVGLTGSLPKSFFTDLPELVFVDLSVNGLEGTIPSEFNNLIKLEALLLGSNLWTGTLPEFYSLQNLKILDLSNLIVLDGKGKLIAHVDALLPDLSRFPKLEYFEGSFSGFKGSIPNQIGKCTHLWYLDLSFNLLEGVLPESLAKCVNLRVFSVQVNRLSGTIPDLSACINLGAKDMSDQYAIGRFYLSENKFSGEFPEWITSLHNANRIALSHNQFTGSIPEDLSGLDVLEALYLSHNNLSGTLPKQLGSALWDIDFSHNQLTGTLPEEWSTSKSLVKASLSNNELSGKTPTIYKKLKDFDNLDVRNNRYSFVDYKGWASFVRNQNVNFRFGMQKPYSNTQKISKNSGDVVTLDASYGGPLLGDETYQWYNMTTMEPVPNANKPQLRLENISEKEAHRYVCFISTKTLINKNIPSLQSDMRTACLHGFISPRLLKRWYQATGQEGEQQVLNVDPGTFRGNADGERTDLDFPPTLVSGFFDLYVDGKINSLQEQPNLQPIYLYPSDISRGEQWQLTGQEEVATIRVFDVQGQKVAESGSGSIIPSTEQLVSGIYFVMIRLHSGRTVCQTVVVN